MSLDQGIVNTVWLIFDVAGQWSLLLLLFIFAFIKDIPQRDNPFLINVLLTTLLGSIPPSLLLYGGNKSSPSNSLCFAQAALVDGVPPLFIVAQMALAFDSWSELGFLILGKRRLTREGPIMWTLLIIPYFAMWIWVFSSFIAAAESKASHNANFAFCENISSASDAVRRYVGVFALVFVALQTMLYIAIIAQLAAYRENKSPKYQLAMKDTRLFAIRVIVLGSLQLLGTVLSVANIAAKSLTLKAAYDLLTSMEPLALTITIGTQKGVLQAGKCFFLRQKQPLPATNLNKVMAGMSDKERDIHKYSEDVER